VGAICGKRMEAPWIMKAVKIAHEQLENSYDRPLAYPRFDLL